MEKIVTEILTSAKSLGSAPKTRNSGFDDNVPALLIAACNQRKLISPINIQYYHICC